MYPAGHSFVPSLIPLAHPPKTVTTPVCKVPGQSQQKLPKTSSKGQRMQGLIPCLLGLCTQGEPDSVLTDTWPARLPKEHQLCPHLFLFLFYTYLFTLLRQRTTWGNIFHHMDPGIKPKSSVLVTSTLYPLSHLPGPGPALPLFMILSFKRCHPPVRMETFTPTQNRALIPFPLIRKNRKGRSNCPPRLRNLIG